MDQDYVNTEAKSKIEQARTARWHAVLIAVTVLLSVYMVAYSIRYDLVPTGKHSAYLLNNWSGSVRLIDFETLVPVAPEFKPPPQDIPVE